MSGSAGSGPRGPAGARVGSRARLQPRGLPIVAGRRLEAGPRAPGLEVCPREAERRREGAGARYKPGTRGIQGLAWGQPRVDCWRARARPGPGGSGGACVGVRAEGTWDRGGARVGARTGSPGCEVSG